MKVYKSYSLNTLQAFAINVSLAIGKVSKGVFILIK